MTNEIKAGKAEDEDIKCDKCGYDLPPDLFATPDNVCYDCIMDEENNSLMQPQFNQ